MNGPSVRPLERAFGLAERILDQLTQITRLLEELLERRREGSRHG